MFELKGGDAGRFVYISPFRVVEIHHQFIGRFFRKPYVPPQDQAIGGGGENIGAGFARYPKDLDRWMSEKGTKDKKEELLRTSVGHFIDRGERGTAGFFLETIIFKKDFKEFNNTNWIK